MHHRTHDGRAYRLLTVIDEAARIALTIKVARRLNCEDVLSCLAELFLGHGPPEHIRSDNGGEFTAKAVRQWLARLGVKTLTIEPGSSVPLSAEIGGLQDDFSKARE